ncbi:uncharacterized protein LOC111697777 isoform X2 [Eurytemora carolleeae]|uniref:uncharacterized protein LOC111697777 isoform X2 n=1 Tax=Eurytemora carolleeae TaxID=1294199 RepID=UPI000C76CEAC|nr:uncharacterized protein LOC111697777 isoform X2 [Eurytemora carolleeae]|eukprot:XP_023323666.1 uncharacterized protein LOC111697777 isoform X2 [Eurytemora affinis]
MFKLMLIIWNFLHLGSSQSSMEDLCPVSTIQDMSGHKTFLHEDWDYETLHSVVRMQLKNIQHLQKIPRITSAEFEKMKIPENLFEFVLGQIDISSSIPEVCSGTGHLNCTPRKTVATFIPLKDIQLVRSTVDEVLRPIVEEWSGIKLGNSQLYFVRRYNKGSRLALHVDKADVNVIGVILNLSQNISTPWDFLVLNSDREVTRILLHPGEMILFESARLPHGRQDPLDGESYDNLFVHFRPVDWNSQDIESEIEKEQTYPTYASISSSNKQI